MKFPFFWGTNFACFAVRFQGECLFVTSSKGHLKFLRIRIFECIFDQKSSPTLAFISCIWTNLMIFQYISSTSDSEIQVNFLRGTLLLNQVWEAWAGSEWRCWLEAAKIHPKTHRSKTLNCEFLSNPLNLSFFFKWWKKGGSGWGPSLNGAEWAPVFWNDILASPDT